MADSKNDPPQPPAGASTSTSGIRVKRKRSITQRVRSAVDSMPMLGHHPDGRIKPLVQYPLYVARILIQVVKQWVRDRCPQQAASLAYGTALSLVPVIAVCVALLRATGSFEAEGSLVDFLSRQVIPISREEIAKYLVSWAGNLSFEAAGIAGVITTTTLAFIMYYSVEDTFNDIWRVKRRRRLGQKFVVFYAVFTMVPALLGVSIYQATRHGLTEGVAGWGISLASTWGALFLANKLLPATRVKWGPAAIGALFSALAFELAKALFGIYIAKVAFRSYAGVYGTLGLVPIFLVWCYYSWLVVLLGAEIAHTTQNLHDLERLDRHALRLDEDSTQFGGVTAARVLCAIAARWRHGEHATPREDLVGLFHLDEALVERILRRLRDGGLVLEVEGDAEGYIPARPLNQMSLADVLHLFRGADFAAPPPAQVAPTRLDDVLKELEAATGARTQALTIDELTREPYAGGVFNPPAGPPT